MRSRHWMRAEPSADEPILPRHPRWDEFIERLAGFEGCLFTVPADAADDDASEMTWHCHGGTDKRFSRQLLRRMGLSEQAIEVSLAYFEDHGGHCDCEVVLNLGRKT